jgi:hypothetical protein
MKAIDEGTKSMNVARHLPWFVVLFMGAVIACSTVPPRELFERNNHGALATWYQDEALRLRGKAGEMREMVQLYANPSYRLGPKESKTELIAHCQLFIDSYTKAAEEADALAKLHLEQDKAVP